MAPVPHLDAARLFVEVAQDLMTQLDTAATRERIVSLAVELTGCTSAAVLKVKPSAGVTVVAGTDQPLAARLARIITETAGGTALQAAFDQGASCESLGRELRWRHYAQRVLSETAIRSEASYPLQFEGADFGVLSMYSDQDGHFREEACTAAEVFTRHALMALLHVRERERARNLEIGLAGNREIGMALGVLMTAHRITDQQAFDLLRKASQHLHLKLRDVAAEVVLVGELPAVPERPAARRPAAQRTLAVAG